MLLNYICLNFSIVKFDLLNIIASASPSYNFENNVALGTTNMDYSYQTAQKSLADKPSNNLINNPSD